MVTFVDGLTTATSTALADDGGAVKAGPPHAVTCACCIASVAALPLAWLPLPCPLLTAISSGPPASGTSPGLTGQQGLDSSSWARLTLLNVLTTEGAWLAPLRRVPFRPSAPRPSTARASPCCPPPRSARAAP